MKKLFLVPVLFPIGFFLVVSGCSKSNNSNSNGDTNKKVTLLTKSSWKLYNSGVDNNNDGIVDVVDATVEACQKDNIYQFNADSTGTMDEGALKCNSGDPQSRSFTWSFNTDQTIIQATVDPTLAGGLNLFSINDTSLIVYKDSAILGVSFRYVLSLKH